MKFTHQENTGTNVVNMAGANYAAMRAAASTEEKFVDFGGGGVWIMQKQNLSINEKTVPYVRLESTELTTVSNEDGSPHSVISYFAEAYTSFMKYGFNVLYWSTANNRYEGPDKNPLVGFRNLVKESNTDKPRNFPTSDFDEKRLSNVLPALKITAAYKLQQRPSATKEINGELISYTPVEVELLKQGTPLGYGYYTPQTVFLKCEIYQKHINVSLNFIEESSEEDLFGSSPVPTTVLPQLSELGGAPVNNGSFAFQCIRRYKDDGTEIKTLSLDPGAKNTSTSPKLSAMLINTNAKVQREAREVLLQIFAQAIGLRWEIPAEYIHGAALKFGEVGQAEMPVNPDAKALAETLGNFQRKPVVFQPEEV